MNLKKGVIGLVVSLSALSLLAACDDPTAAQQSPVPLQSAPDPSIREAAKAAPSFDVGHTVHITDAGIQPLALASTCCSAVVFKNETGSPVAVMFNISKVTSGAIAPGGTWSWVPPNPESVIYHLVSNPKSMAQIQVESPDW